MRFRYAFFALPLLVSTAGAGPLPPVIGGENAPEGMWPDVAAIMYSGQQECSGTLVAPTVVLTAGHCADASEGPPPDHVLVGTNSLAHPERGETIAIQSFMQFPNWESSSDVTVLILATPAKETPRAIATGWARLDIINGAQVNFVGYGAIDKNAEQYIDDLQQATSTITDADCTKSAGCNSGARPAGELGAGGGGIDTCPGDSGGPMYLPTSYGTFLAGVTSRGYSTDQFFCSEGGIYERPDHIVDFIEQVAGSPVARGPEPALDAELDGARGDGVTASIAVNDPVTTSDGDHTVEIKTQPAHGTAATNGSKLRVCIAKDAPAGDDSVTLTFTDKNDSTRSIDQTFRISVEDADGAADCDVQDFGAGGGGSDGGGCCDSGRSAGGSIPLALGLGALFVGRRRRAKR